MSKIPASILAVIMIAIFITGCPKKQTVVSDSAIASSEAKAEAEAKALAEAEARREAEEKAEREAEEKKRAEEAKAFKAKDIHFDFDRYDIRESDRETLRTLAEWLMKNRDAKLRIEGYADERGDDEYNLALGDRRAYNAMEYLAALGISESRMSYITYGEEKPVCTEPDESCWWKNRRGHFVINGMVLSSK